MVSERASPLALLFCENVLTDLEGRRSLIGLLDGIQASKFPVKLRRLVIYFLAKNPLAAVSLQVSLRSRETGETLFNQTVELEPNPTHSQTEMGFIIGDVEWPRPGEYVCEVRQDTMIVIERTMTLRLAESKSPSESKEEAHS